VPAEGHTGRRVLAGITPHGGALKTEALPYCGRLRLFGAAFVNLTAADSLSLERDQIGLTVDWRL
jgi:hypothetical protein